MALAEFGYSRDGQKNQKPINYGRLLDPAGRPVGLEVFPGNTVDPATLGVQLKKLRKPYGWSKVTLVGDRGRLTPARLRDEVEPAGYTGITARRKATLRRVMEQQNVPWSLLDEPDLAEVESEDFPGERLIRCRNPLQADQQARTRAKWLERTEQKRDPLVAATQRARRPPGGGRTGWRGGPGASWSGIRRKNTSTSRSPRPRSPTRAGKRSCRRTPAWTGCTRFGPMGRSRIGRPRRS